jgi:hypothetical protein
MVEQALHAAKARTAKDGNFGQVISEEEATDGDIIAFSNCTFSAPQSTYTRGAPLHAAVVKRAREGRVFNVWEAGADGVSTPVADATYNMTHLREGTVRCVCGVPHCVHGAATLCRPGVCSCVVWGWVVCGWVREGGCARSLPCSAKIRTNFVDHLRATQSHKYQQQ